MQTSHIYPGAHSLNAYITINGCSNAIEFYKKAFGAIEKVRLLMPGGKIGHAEIEVEGSLLMMADENIDWENKSPLTIEGNPMTFGLYVMDVYAVFQKVLDAGATSVMAIEDMFYDDLVVQVMIHLAING